MGKNILLAHTCNMFTVTHDIKCYNLGLSVKSSTLKQAKHILNNQSTQEGQ